MTSAPGETLEGASILGELRGDLSVLLWRTVRDLTLWAATAPATRSALFAAAGEKRVKRLITTDVPPPLTSPLDTIHAMLTLGERADADVLTICCLQISAWAAESRAPHTALAFAQAGALVSPEFPEAALRTGMAALTVEQDARAGTWFRRAVALGRREREWCTYVAGLVELAVLEERLGTQARAEHLFRAALRAARRWGNRQAYGRAALGLCRATRRRGDTVSAAVYAISAERAFRRKVKAAPDVLLELARFWMETGDFGAARAALRRLAPTRAQLAPADQLSSWALSARAFARSDAAFSAAAAAKAWETLLDAALPQPIRIAAAVDLAYAAGLSGDAAAFTRAKHLVLALSPANGADGSAAEVERLWAMERKPGLRRPA